ncbi:hypothetical protein D049_0739B, partial [Vibrio parahaemolyticus VPTS-2010]
GTA